jgi:BMFP domain-containing protein YqiC
MITEQLQHIIDEMTKLPPEEQDRVAAAIRAMLEQPPVTSDAVRPEVMEAFEQVMAHSTEVLDYLRDK